MNIEAIITYNWISILYFKDVLIPKEIPILMHGRNVVFAYERFVISLKIFHYDLFRY